ncbi:uncharacterized protein stradb isoform X7 [Brachyistius frenatus]|uniref:uncharacterized protein stradb isoform X7 n=1 Tax=Brachyistius frenatus TaxID=100188 RepID=UPI0037E77AD8
MSFLDCSCISHAQVQPADIEERYEDIGHQFPSCDGSEYTPQGPAGGDDVTGLSAEPAHYQLLSELGRGFNNLSQVNMARHIPTGQLVAVKQTNLDECTEEELLQLTNEVLLSRLFRHSNLLTSRLVFSSCCQLWVLTPLMAYGSARLRSEIGHLQFGYRGLRAGQRPGALPGHASDSDVAAEAARLPLLPAGRGALPPRRAGGPEGVAVRRGLRHRGERGHGQHDAQRRRSPRRPTPEPRAQEPLGHPARPGAAVSAAAARAQTVGDRTVDPRLLQAGEEAHQRLLPQPHVPGGAPQQPGGPSRIQPPHPFLPRSAVGRRRRGGSLGLLLTPLPPPLSHTQHYILKS